MSVQYTHLQCEERMTLASLRQQGFSLRAIARLMARSASTLSRELARSSSTCGYASVPAHELSCQRRIDMRPLPKLHAGGTLWRVVCDLLSWRWSPQ
jgi:IS30 family transposase